MAKTISQILKKTDLKKPPCCRDAKIQNLISKLKEKGKINKDISDDTFETDDELDVYASYVKGMSKHVKGLPKEADKYYESCKKRYGDSPEKKTYCARVAWDIYCSHVNPNHSSCISFRKNKNEK